MTLQVRISDALHQELTNWARWCWSGAWPHPLPATECGSLEAGYRAPPQWGDDRDGRRAPIVRPNDRRARAVQVVWEKLAPDERAVVKEEYPAALEWRCVQGREAAAQRLGMSLGSYEHLLQVAVYVMEVELEVRD